MQSQPTYQLGSREKPQYYGRNQHHEVADNYIYQGIEISHIRWLLKTAQTQKKQSDLGLKGQKYFNIALVLQDETYNFTRPANTCTCPLKGYAIKNIRE